MTHSRLAGFVFLMLAIVAQGQGKLEGREAARRFVSEKYGFSMMVPTEWLSQGARDTPLYFNYPVSQALPQGRLPDGGAEIAVTVRETLSGGRFGKTLSEWATNDMRIEADGTPSSPEPFEMPPESRAKSAIVLSYDSAVSEVGQQKEHEKAVYWEFEGRFFAAHLFYIANDPKAAALEKTFLDTVRSFRPLRPQEKR